MSCPSARRRPSRRPQSGRWRWTSHSVLKNGYFAASSVSVLCRRGVIYCSFRYRQSHRHSTVKPHRAVSLDTLCAARSRRQAAIVPRAGKQGAERLNRRRQTDHAGRGKLARLLSRARKSPLIFRHLREYTVEADVRYHHTGKARAWLKSAGVGPVSIKPQA